MIGEERERWYQSYNESFIIPADPFRYNVETKSIPRLRDIRQVNLKDDIARGWRAEVRPSRWGYVLGLTPQERDELWRLSPQRQLGECTEYGEPIFFRKFDRYYRRLDSVSERTGLPYICRHFLQKARSSKSNLKWYLVQFPRRAMVNFLQFDFDIHGVLTRETLNALHHLVGKIEAAVKSHGGQIVWTTSPGDLYEGQHVQGLYAWIKLDRHYRVEHLIDNKVRIKRALNLPEELEFSWDHAHRPIRLGGQQYVEVVDPRTLELKARVDTDEPQRKAFDAFCQAWHSAKPLPLDQFADLHPDKGEVRDATLKAKAQNLTPSSLARPRSMTGQGRRTDVGKNTWKIALKTVSETMHLHQGCAALAEKEAIRLMRERCQPDSRTCSDPASLRKLVSRVTCHFAKNFRPKNRRRAQDTKRFTRHTMDVDVEDIMKVVSCYLDLNGLKNTMRRYLRVLLQKNGRLDCRTLYDSPNAIFSKRTWFRLNPRTAEVLCGDFKNTPCGAPRYLSNFIFVIDRYDRGSRKCTQYGFTPFLISELKKLQSRREKAQEFLQAFDRETAFHCYVIISRTPVRHDTESHSFTLDPTASEDTANVFARAKRWSSSVFGIP